MPDAAMLRSNRDTAHWPQRQGTGAMAEKPAKLRVAMGVFDDLPHLNAAAVTLSDLGLEGENLCFVTDRAAVPPSAGEFWTVAGQTSRLVCFQYAPTPPSDSRALFAARMACLIAGALNTVSAFKSQNLRAFHLWSAIDAQLSQGALLLAALAPSTALQDRAVRILLRYSPHPVHAEEFLQPGELN